MTITVLAVQSGTGTDHNKQTLVVLGVEKLGANIRIQAKKILS